MQIKIQCQCGTKFSFEVEPVNGQMPVRINCPTCGADGTELANAVIQARLAPAETSVQESPVVAPPAHGMRFHIHKAAPPQPQPTPPAKEPEAAGEAERCPKHPREPVVEHCRVCGKPICAKCMEFFGYVCSVYCRNQAERQKMHIPVYKHQRAVLEQKSRTRTRLVIAACSLLLVAFLGAWIWYAFVGSHPKVVYSQNIPQGDRARFYELLSPHDVLSVFDGQMTLYDVAQQKQLWSTKVGATSAFQSSDPDGAASDSEDSSPQSLLQGTFVDESESGSEPRVIVTANSIWLVFADHLEQHDRKSGSQQKNIPLKTPVIGLEDSGHCIIAISRTGPERRTVTRVALPEGTVQTEQIGPEQTKPTAVGEKGAAGAGAYATRRQMAASGFANASGLEETEEYFADGAGVSQVKIRLLERKIITHEAMKPKGKSLVNNQLSANASIEASEQELNDIRREEGSDVVKEDVSRYQVSLQRLPAKGVPEWSGEVIGPPAFYSLKTVNVLAGGKAIDVFDKNGKKIWDAKTTYSLPEKDLRHKLTPPCLESGDTLYVYDQGMLNAFDLMSGQVRWRLTSVGISKVQTGPSGNLYVDSTTASPDSIQFSRQVDILKIPQPLLMKVDPKTGKVLWRAKGIVTDCFLSGKFLYASMSSVDPLAALNQEKNPAHYYNLYRLNPSNGNVLWHYYQSKWPVQTYVQGNWILLHFPDQLQVLKFLSF